MTGAGIAILPLALALASCMSTPAVLRDEPPATASSLSLNPSPTTSHASGLPPCRDRRAWITVTSTNPALTFDAPVLGEWEREERLLRIKSGDWGGYKYSAGAYCGIGQHGVGGDQFGGVSSRYSEGSERVYTDNYRWFMSDGRTMVDQAGRKPFRYSVRPLDFLTADSGARAVIFNGSTARPWDVRPSDRKGELVAVINFPAGYDERYKSLTMHFLERITLAQVQRAVRSLRFTE